MAIEFEATYLNINKDDIRNKLKSLNARLLKPEFMQKRHVFNLPPGISRPSAWARVRDEGDRITLSFKEIAGSKIEDQHEIQLTIDSFDNGSELLKSLGCEDKAYQESYREIWDLNGAEICIDTWPFLDPYIEIEAESEDVVKNTSISLGFDYSQAYFGAADDIYAKVYGIDPSIINNNTPLLTFTMPNPFE